MTREEALAWAKSLKPGDVVIHHLPMDYVYALTVEKVTPTGIVKTNDGKSFAQTSWSDHLIGRGNVCGHITPATDELIEKAKKQEKEMQEEKRRNVTRNIAVAKMRSAVLLRISYEFAVEFLELCNKYGI